jgi:hypothetical protein
MKYTLYASAVGCLMYADVCIRSDIEMTIGLLGQWIATNKVLWYMQGTKNYNLT